MLNSTCLPSIFKIKQESHTYFFFSCLFFPPLNICHRISKIFTASFTTNSGPNIRKKIFCLLINLRKIILENAFRNSNVRTGLLFKMTPPPPLPQLFFFQTQIIAPQAHFKDDSTPSSFCCSPMTNCRSCSP